MADTKITSLLTPQVTTNPATDVLPIVNIADTSMASSGSTRKITVNTLLGAGGTATLASATITGDLTVDTSTLKVDSANNWVGIGTATPGFALDVQSATGTVIRTKGGSGSGQGSAIYVTAAGSTSTFFAVGDRANIFGGTPDVTASIYTAPSIPLTFDVGGSTAMTLNSTGLGLGGSASGLERFVVFSGASKMMSIDTNGTFFADGGTGKGRVTIENSSATNSILSTTTLFGSYNILKTAASQHQWFIGGSTQAMTLDASGNLLVGTTSAGGNRLNVQTASGDCTTLIKSQAANTNLAIDYVSNYGNYTIRKSGTAVWDYGVVSDSSATPAFKIQNASSVGVQLVSGATAWTTLSDETMKDIIEPISNAVSKVGLIRSVIGKFKTDDASKRRSFLIAQDVQSVLPEAVDVIGENNELGLRYTEVIPLLVAAIKELTAEVNALKKA